MEDLLGELIWELALPSGYLVSFIVCILLALEIKIGSVVWSNGNMNPNCGFSFEVVHARSISSGKV
jgi:hypothetical protein